MLRIKLFGTPSVWRGEVQLGGALAQRRRLALVAALAALAPPGRPAVSRERLLELLWSGDDDERGRAALSQALYAVRRDLGADDAIVGSGELRLNPERVACDYWEFLQFAAEGADSAAADLRHAPVFDDFDVPEARGFSLWAERLTAEVDTQWSQTATRAAEQAERAGDWPRAVRYRRALANVDPLASGTATALAVALARAGEREAALRHLRVHSALVEQELEAAPSAEVTALVALLQRGELPEDQPAGVSVPSEMPPDAAIAPATAIAVPAPANSAPPPAGPMTPPAAASPEAPLVAVAAMRPMWRWPIFAATAVVVALVGIAVMRRDDDGRTSGRAPATASVDAPMVLAVGRIIGDSLGDAVSSMLATNMARAGDVRVVSHARMLELQQSFAGPATGQLAAAREAGADVLIEGSLVRDGTAWRLSLTRTRVREGLVEQSWQFAGAEVFALVDRASAGVLAGVSAQAPTTSVATVSTQSLAAWRLYDEARRSQVAGRIDAARAQLRGALAEDSTFAMAAFTLSGLLPVGAPEYKAALAQALRMSDRTAPRDALLIRAAWLADINDPSSAAVYDTLALRFPDDLEVRMNLASPALFQRADFARAYDALIGVWRADSARIGRTGGGRCYACEVPIHFATVAEHQDSLALAERWVRRYLALAPDDANAWDRLAGILERDVARHREMTEAIERSVRLGKTNARRHVQVAATRRGDWESFRVSEQADAATLQQTNLDRSWNRTIILRNIGRGEDALREARAYRRLAERAGNDRVPATVLEALVEWERGNPRVASALFDSIAVATVPGEQEPLRARRVVWNRTLAATARYDAGDTTGLMTLADTLAVLGPRSRYVRDHYLHHHVRGLAWLALGRLDEAIAELQRAIVFPNMGFTRTNWYLAQALRRQGREAEARRYLEAAARGTRDAAGLYLNPLTVRAALR